LSTTQLPKPFEGAVGLFDSGVGGLSVLRAVRSLLPDLDLVYVADSLHAPYGEQSQSFIKERTLSLGLMLEQGGVRAIVVACNTATVLAVKALREQTALIIVAIEPAIKPAVSHTKSGVVGVLATTQTSQSQSVKRLCELYGTDTKIIVQACPGLVELVESGLHQSDEARALLAHYVEPLIEQGADTLVLGCTHYSFLKDTIQAVAGIGVELIDPCDAVARELARRLSAQSLTSLPQSLEGQQASLTTDPDTKVKSSHSKGQTRLFTTGSIAIAQTVMSQLWGEDIVVESFAGSIF
jgi:glutamate racemase